MTKMALTCATYARR